MRPSRASPAPCAPRRRRTRGGRSREVRARAAAAPPLRRHRRRCRRRPLSAAPAPPTIAPGNLATTLVLLTMSLLGPTNLTAPYAFSLLGWPAAVVICVAFTAASAWCGAHAALLFHRPGGGRCESYGAAAAAALAGRGRGGARAAAAVNAVQHGLNLVNSIVCVILISQLLQAFCAHASAPHAPPGGPACPAMPSYAAWTAVAGALQLVLLLAAPYPSHLVAVLAAGGVLFAFYMGTGLALAVESRPTRKGAQGVGRGGASGGGCSLLSTWATASPSPSSRTLPARVRGHGERRRRRRLAYGSRARDGRPSLDRRPPQPTPAPAHPWPLPHDPPSSLPQHMHTPNTPLLPQWPMICPPTP
jgi:hypothetical protein